MVVVAVVISTAFLTTSCKKDNNTVYTDTVIDITPPVNTRVGDPGAFVMLNDTTYIDQGDMATDNHGYALTVYSNFDTVVDYTITGEYCISPTLCCGLKSHIFVMR